MHVLPSPALRKENSGHQDRPEKHASRRPKAHLNGPETASGWRLRAPDSAGLGLKGQERQ